MTNLVQQVRAVVLVAFAIGMVSHAARGEEVMGFQAAAAIEETLVAAIAKAEKSVVSIARVRLEEVSAGPADPRDPEFIPNDFATGVVVDRRGLVLTNHHVLADESVYYVTTPAGDTYSARVRGADPRSDLAVLELDLRGQSAEFVPIEFGDAEALKKGQLVVALGNPYAIARDGQVSASWGIVANLSRKAGPTYLPEQEVPHPPKGKTTLHHFGTLIQTDAKLNLGTSGGALVNLRGQMVGLTTSEAAIVGYEQSAGYAIPVDETFHWVLNTLKEGREVEYGFLGVAPRNLPPEVKPRGVRLFRVVPGTPAHEVNLQDEDIITAVNGRSISDADGLMLHVGKLPVESAVRLTVERGGRVMQLTPVLTKFPVIGQKVVTVPAPDWRGLRVDYRTAVLEFRDRLSDGLAAGGVVVTEVATDSPAWEAGLRPFDLVTHLAGVPVNTPKDFFAVAADKAGPVEVQVYQGPRSRDVRVVEP